MLSIKLELWGLFNTYDVSALEKKKKNMKESVILQSLQNAVDLEHSEIYRAAFWQKSLEANSLSLNDIFRDISLLCK